MVASLSLTYRPGEFRTFFWCELNPLVPKFLGKTTGGGCSKLLGFFWVTLHECQGTVPVACVVLFGKKTRHEIPQKSTGTF